MQSKPHKRIKPKKWVILGTGGSIIKFEPRNMRVISSKLRNQYCQWYSVAKEIMVTPDTKS